MSQAEELLDSLSEGETTTDTLTPEEEPHIVINADKSVTVPDELKEIAVQFDHNVKTVTFDCPRYWDGRDLSDMKLYVNYQRPDGFKDSHPVENFSVDKTDESITHFEWTISDNVTKVKGDIMFLVCAKVANSEGVLEKHWNSKLNRELTILEGMDCVEGVVERNPDIIEKILADLDSTVRLVDGLQFAQSDMYQTDPEALDFVKNNPIEKSSVVKELVFDGEYDGKIYKEFTVDGVPFNSFLLKMSDDTPVIDDLLSVTYDQNDGSGAQVVEWEDMLAYFNDGESEGFTGYNIGSWVYVVTEDSPNTTLGISLEKGIWFRGADASSLGAGKVISCLSISYNSETRQLKPDLLPPHTHENGNIVDLIPTTVPVIPTAKVGQMVTVKAVDNNGVPTEWDVIDRPSTEGLATESYVDTKVANLVGSSPEALNTLDELAAALNDDENFATTITNQIASKQEAITGTAGQFVVIGEDGKPTCATIPSAKGVSF